MNVGTYIDECRYTYTYVCLYVYAYTFYYKANALYVISKYLHI